MRMFRLADIFELKYSLKSEAADLKDVMRDVVENIKIAFINYIDPKTIKSKAYNAIPVFASRDEPHCHKIMGHMYQIVSQIDTLAAHPASLFRELNKVLALVSSLDEAIKNTRKQTQEFLPSQQVLNQHRNDLKRLEESLKRFSSLMVKAAKPLKALLPEPVALEGGEVVPEVMPLSKEERRQFILYDPRAEKYGFNSPDIVENLDMAQALLDNPAMGAKFDRLVRAVKRSSEGRSPAPETVADIVEFLNSFKELIRQRKQTNLPALEKMPEKPPTTFEEEGEAWDHKMAYKYNDLTLGRYLK